MDRIVLISVDRAPLIDRVSSHIEHPSQHPLANRHRDGASTVGNLESSLETLGSRHRNRANPPVAEMLLHLEGYLHSLILDLVVDSQRVIDSRKFIRKLDVNNWTDHLNDFS